MMTTMSPLLGGVPLMLGVGTGAEIRQRLGYAIIGGLIVSQALKLYTTPVVFLRVDRLNVCSPALLVPKRGGWPVESRIGRSHRLWPATWWIEVPEAVAGRLQETRGAFGRHVFQARL
jgi:hypothetical protein